jgi:hypothetical protein
MAHPDPRAQPQARASSLAPLEPVVPQPVVEPPADPEPEEPERSNGGLARARQPLGHGRRPAYRDLSDRGDTDQWHVRVQRGSLVEAAT